MTKTDIISTRYSGNQRISDAVITVDKSDDLYTLAALQSQYEAILRDIEEARKRGDDTTGFERDRDRIKSELDAQQIIVDGYERGE